MHPLDRPHQLSTYRKIIASPAKYVIVRAPTGSGKSAFVAQAKEDGHKSLVLTSTKSLQAQYEGSYDFTPLYGKGNYKCGVNSKIDCDICTPKDEKGCKDKCPYPLAKSEFIASTGGSLNYAKFLLDRRTAEAFEPEILWLDEAHELKRVVINNCGITLHWSNKYLKDYIEPIMIDLPPPMAIPRGQKFLQELADSLENNKPIHPNDGGDIKLFRWHERLSFEVNNTLEQMDIAPWLVHSDHTKFTCNPMSAKYHFQSLFRYASKVVLMSATIRPNDVAILGITDYEFISVPNSIPALMRPVYNLPAPAYTNFSSGEDKQAHAQIIAKPFLDRPEWNGLVHVTSENMAQELGNRLYDLTRRPIWIGEKGQGTNEAYDDWLMYLGSNPNAIAVTWQFMTGVDMGHVNINITARMPYPNFGDKFEKAMFDHNPNEARIEVANLVEQQQGRNRRGYPEHYGGLAQKYNAIVDGKFSKLKSAFSNDFLAAIQ